MPLYRIFYLNDSEVTSFRHAPPRQQPCQLKQRHYEPQGEIEAPSPYAAWQMLQDEQAEARGLRSMGVGDVLETEQSEVLLCNFWGFDRAEWHVPHAGQRPESEGDFGGQAGAASPVS